MVEKSGIIQNNRNTFAFFYRLADLVAITVAFYAAVLIVGIHYTYHYTFLLLIMLVGFAFSAESFILYRSWRSGDAKQMVFYTLLSCIFACLAVFAFMFFSKSSEIYSRLTVGIWFCLQFSSLAFWRLGFMLFLKHMRRNGYNTRRVAILGLADGGRLAQQILDNPDTGYRLEAIYDDRRKERIDKTYHAWLKGNIEQGIESARNNEFDVIFIALPMSAQHRIKAILQLLGDTTANVHVVPDLFVFCLMNASMAHVGEVQTISVYNNPMGGGTSVLKRAEDLFLAITILAVIAIPMLLITLAIKLTSKGPVIFKQDRYGLDGRKIKVWKFRSMTVSENSDVVTQATKNDKRVTKVGAFLRKTSLDELPQFINVLKGDMSVVGPRPHAVAHNEQFRKQVDYYMLRHKVKPGITGWAQVNGWRGETDTIDKMEMRIRYDLEYIRDWSLWMDFKIVLFTMFRSFNDKNAY